MGDVSLDAFPTSHSTANTSAHRILRILIADLRETGEKKGVFGFTPRARVRIISAVVSLAYSFEGNDGELSETRLLMIPVMSVSIRCSVCITLPSEAVSKDCGMCIVVNINLR
jgi:LSD1 subclass zinc finger protein